MPRISRRALPASHRRAGALSHRKRLVHATAAGRIAGRIVETEAYPPGDPTGYARPGLTTSNAPLFAARGMAYVRMVYGACLTLNIAAEGSGVGAAVLIRALEPMEGIDLMLQEPPGIAPARSGARARAGVRGARHRPRTVRRGSLHERECCGWNAGGDAGVDPGGTRIGLSRDQHRRLRFLERGSPFVSVPP